MNKIDAFLLSPTFLSLFGFALLLLLTLWLLNTFKMPPKRGPNLRNWLRGNYWLAMVVAGLTLGGAAAFFYLIEIGISVRAIVDRLVTAAADPSTPAEDLRNLGTATGILLAALAAAATLVFQLVRVWITERQTTTAEQNLITDRINQAVAGLGSEKVEKVPAPGPDGTSIMIEQSAPNIEVRVGAILSLERISENSAEDHVRIMEILCAYVRENACIVPTQAKPENPEDWKQRTDTQMALTVIGRRRPDRIALEQAPGTDYRLDLRAADMQLADMSKGAWQKTRFDAAVMARALLFDANLQEANLRNANLQEAFLRDAKLQEANLGDANLQKAYLGDANLQEAYLGDANLQKANLGDANLQEAVNSAFGVASGIGRTILPEGLTPPAHWHVAEEAEEESFAHIKAAEGAYEEWLATLPPESD